MTVQELRDTLAKLVELLEATDAKAATTKGLKEFIEAATTFDDLKLKDFVKLAEKGRNPPEAATPRPRNSRSSGAPAVDPGALAAEVKSLYERAADKAVTEEAIRDTCGRLGSLKKNELVKIAEGIELAGMKSKKVSEIVTQITNRLLERKGAAIRGQLINRPPNDGATSDPTPTLVPTEGA